MESATNCNPDKEDKMTLDWSYPKKNHWIHTEAGIRLEPPGGRPKKIYKRAVEEEGMEVGKAWSKIKRIAVDMSRRKRFTDALRSRGRNRN
jgi:hypothetical protein